MKRIGKKSVALAVGCVAAVSCAASGLIGCHRIEITDSDVLAAINDVIIRSAFGGDVFGRNAFIADPAGSYGLGEIENPEWPSYSAMSQNDIDETLKAFKSLAKELDGIRFSQLDEKDKRIYRTLDGMIDDQIAYYGSAYASDFMLFGSSYISSDGGDVADFATSFENYTFRNETDIKYLLEVTQSVKHAFGTYIDYAADRASAGYPLYDYSITGMQNYLDEVYGQGKEYYLYTVANNMIDGAQFLSAAQKTDYKQKFDAALTDGFMSGVKTLSAGLELYKNKATAQDKSYLAQYGKKGRAYYEWRFSQMTGMKKPDMLEVFNEFYDYYVDSYAQMQAVLDKVAEYEDGADRAVYDGFYEYFHGDSVYLGLTDPYDILDYLKNAAKSIVPDLIAAPEIGIKYMDETAGKVSNTIAYYYVSPVDEKSSHEYITINPALTEDDEAGLLTLMAHEGYPGHLYAHVQSKERGEALTTAAFGRIAFSEGWSRYVEGAVLDHIAASADDTALALYCEYDKLDSVCNYASNMIFDFQVNYIGYGVSDFVDDGIPADQAERIITLLSEHPAQFVPYGYGGYYMEYLHDLARTELGGKYDEVKFNGALLAEGDSQSLDRAKEITLEFIKENK